jgi:CDP-diacylglycerol--glycerol-3-phosphate 3-phosphatidyltransferase
LKRRWWFVALGFGLAVSGGYIALYVAWHPSLATQWGIGSASALLYLLGYTRFHLPLNRHHPEASVLPTLGISNGLTLARGLLYGLLAGFIVLPPPDGVWAFVPGLLYTVASLTDLLDGHIARKRDETTDLGAKLDVEVDSVGILVAFILGAKFQQLPPVFAVVGGLFYAYRFYLWSRRRRGKPVHALPYSQWRSTIGGFEVGFLCVMLWPVFSPPFTTAVGVVVGTLVVASFVWDGMLATGRLDAEGGLYRRATEEMHRWGLGILPLVVRVAGGAAGAWILWHGSWSEVSLSLHLLTLATGMASCVALVGWGGRWSGLFLLSASAFLSLVAAPSWPLVFLVVGGFLLMLTGSGYYALGRHFRVKLV